MPEVFERHEKKFIVKQHQYRALMGAFAPHLQPDAYGRHTICSLYLDSPDLLCARWQEQRPDFREKLRLRSYGVPAERDTVYLELKKKAGGVTHKRRTPLTLAEANAYIQYGRPPLDAGQVFGEIDWFARRIGASPTVSICYERVALVGREDPGLRVTADRNLCWRDTDLDLAAGTFGQPLLGPGEVMLEIKTLGALPAWMARILSQTQVYSVSFSKYLNACVQMQNREVRQHAG